MTDVPFCFMFIGLIAVIGGSVSLVYIFLLPVALIFGWLAQKRLRELAHEEIQRGHERHGLLVDTIQGAETIQATGGGWRFADTWRAITGTMAGYSLRSKLISSTTSITTGSLGTIAYVSAIVVGVTLIESGDLTTGGLIACTILGGRVINPIAQSVQLLVQWQHVRESLTMVNRLLDLETDRREDQTLLVPDTLADTLDFEGTRFSYPNSPLQRLDIQELNFKAGDRVVILGPNGSGKSTLLKVAAGLYKPGEGQVRLGGADLWELDPQVVNERIGYLPQDVHLFKGSLRSNMALGGGVSDSKLLEVAQLLGIDRVAADNPRSMDLEISEGGQGLSGGQRQLVGLSRVFLAQPQVWLLDEPSASLDMESENKVLEAINQWARPTDIVLIATHRPRLTTLANRVIVMRRGQIVADGKPEDVLPGRPRNQFRQAGSATGVRN
jgi:ATP-binding cassette subfamily C protein LapB